MSEVPAADTGGELGLGDDGEFAVGEVSEEVGEFVREHDGRGRADRAGPVVVHEAELVGEREERVRADFDVGALRAVVQDRVVDGVGEALARGEGDDVEVVHAGARDEVVDDGALCAAFVLLRAEDLGVDALVDDDVDEARADGVLGEHVLDGADLLVERSLELALADAVALDDDARGPDVVERAEALRAALDAARDLRAHLLLHLLRLDVAGVLAEVLVERGGEAHDALAVAVPDVHAAHHGGRVGTLGLHEAPGRAVVEFGDDLREDLADDAGDALACERLGEYDLGGHGEFGDGEPLGELVEVEVVFLAAACGDDEQEEVCGAQVAHGLEPGLGVAGQFVHERLADVEVRALAGGLELVEEGPLRLHVLLVALQREDGPFEGVGGGEHAALRLAVEHRLGGEVVLFVLAERDSPGLHAPAVEAEHGGPPALQPDVLAFEEFLAFAEDAREEVALLLDADVLARLGFEQLHHEAARAQLVVEPGFAAELGHQVDRVRLASASALLLADQHRLVVRLDGAAPAFAQLVLLRDLALLAALAAQREPVRGRHLEVHVRDALGLGGVVLRDDLAALEALEQLLLEVALAEPAAELVHRLEHGLVEVDLLGGVDFDEAALDVVFVGAQVDGGAEARDDADGLLRVDLRARADVEELASDLRVLALELRAVEDVVEERLLELGLVGGARRRQRQLLGLALDHQAAHRRALHALRADHLRPEQHLVADLARQLVASRVAEHLLLQVRLLLGHFRTQLHPLHRHVTRFEFERVHPHGVPLDCSAFVFKKFWSLCKLHS